MSTVEIEAQLAAIRNEVEEEPLLSEPDDLGAPSAIIRVEFCGNELILSQLDEVIMKRSQSGGELPVMVRYARRDGNCFFRCASFALFGLMRTSLDFAESCQERLVEWKSVLVAQFGDYSEDFYEVVHAEIERFCLADHGLTDEDVVKFSTGEDAPYAIIFFRYLVSLYLRSQSELYAPFIMAQGYDTVDAYCTAEVEPVDHVSDDTQIAAFANLFNVRLEVYALERSGGAHVTRHVFNEEAPASQRISLLFRPGHYDLIL